jgi:acetylornithine deacetylase/succinyl-diaminopimelate desuccinylase-like protein
MPGQRQVDVAVEFEKIVTEAAKAADISFELTLIQNTPGAQVSIDEPVVQTIARVHKELTGNDPLYVWEGYHADTTALTRYGIPTICYGPGGAMRGGGSGYYAEEGEMCYLPDLVVGAKVFTRLALEFCNSPRHQMIPTTKPWGTSVVFG